MQHSQWKGQTPQRFEPGRKHLRPTDEIGPSLQPTLSNIGACGIRTFGQKLSEEQIYRPHLKIFPEQFQRPQKEIQLKGKKFVGLSQQKERVRHQKAHIPGGYETTSQLQNRGIKSYAISNALTQTQYNLQNKMQRKTRVQTYQQTRNGLGTSALGDKPYKYPEYCPNFYHQGGLIPGSTFRPIPHPEKQKQLEKNKKISVFTKPNWDVRVLMDEVAEEKKVVNAVDEWEQTVLKEANPNWNDPDTFFQRMEAKKEVKDVKKAGKK